MTPQAHQTGREAIRQAYLAVFGREPSPLELQAIAAISIGESPYGLGVFKRLSIPDGAVVELIRGTNNWGAVQCSNRPPCDGVSCFEATDTNPDAQTDENPKGYYQACFRKHATPVEGATHFIRTLLEKRPSVLEAMQTGSAQEIATAMRKTNYYQGFGATQAIRIGHYADNIFKHAQEVASTLNEPLLVSREGSPGGTPDLSTFPDWW